MYMTLSEGESAMMNAIAEHMLGNSGSLTKAAAIADILIALNSGPKTIAAIQLLINEVKPEFIPA